MDISYIKYKNSKTPHKLFLILEENDYLIKGFDITSASKAQIHGIKKFKKYKDPKNLYEAMVKKFNFQFKSLKKKKIQARKNYSI